LKAETEREFSPGDDPDLLLPTYGPRVKVPLWDPGPGLSNPWAALRGLISRRGTVNELANALGTRTGARYVACYSSGGAALTAGLLASKLPCDGEVILPSYLCHRVADAVISAGLRICLVDIGDDSLISPLAVEAAITDSTCAVVAAHLYGKVCDMPALEGIARDHNLTLVDDAAQALGAYSGSVPAGTMGNFGIISFGPGKIGSGIGGGCLLTDSEDLFRALPDASQPPGFLEELKHEGRYLFEKRVRMAAAPYRHLKRRKSPRRYRVSREKPPKRIAVEGMGIVQSRACLALLDDLEGELETRRGISVKLGTALGDIDAVFPADEAGRVWGAYPIRLRNSHRYPVCAELSRRFVETFPPYLPLHMQDRYLEHSRVASGMGNSEEAFRRLVVLPLHRGIGDDQVNLMIEETRRAVGPGR
jgi:dTDP-4-amino-4,6-dideoxygalactose transaminase